MDFSALRALEEELLGSATRQGSNRVRDLLHPHFTEIGRSGLQWSRDEIVEALANESAREPVTTADWEFSQLAPGVALLCFTVQGPDGNSRHSSVWVSEDKPQLRFHQGTFIAAQQPRLSVVVALPNPIAVGTTINRREWPPHVTLASNFSVDAPRDVLEQAVSDRFAGEEPLTIVFAGEALFGPNHDIPVQLIESDQVIALHEHLADVLERMPDFAAEQPAFWRAGYRPHMTHAAGVQTLTGERQELPYIAIAELTATTATIHTSIALPARP